MRTRLSEASRIGLRLLAGGAALAACVALIGWGEHPATGAQLKSKSAAPKAKAKAKAKKGPKVLAAAPDLWKVEVDPPAEEAEAPDADQEIVVRIPPGWGNEEVVYTNGPSPFVAVGSKDRREVWDLASKKRVGVITSRDVDKPFALSDDGSLFAGKTGGFNKGVAVFSTKNGKQVAQLKAEHPFLNVVEFAGTDKVITGNAGDRQFEVWDIESGKSETDISPKGKVSEQSVTVSPGGKYLAFVSDEGKGLWVHDVESGKRVGEIEIPKNNIFNLNCKGLMFSPDGKELAGVFESFGVYLFCWDVATGQTVAEFKWDDKTGNIKAPPGFNGKGIDWLPDKSGWLLFGAIVVDRVSGEKVFTIPSDTPNANKGARRIMGAGVVMIPVGDGNNRSLRSYKLPTDKIAAAAKIVQEGGNAADATLPPLKTADLAGAKKVAVDDKASWSAVPDPDSGKKTGLANRALTLKCGANEVQDIHFAGLAAARVAVTSIPGGLNPFNPNENEGKPRRVETYDLAGGRNVARFDLPGVSEPLGVSPDGTRVIATDTKEHSRLDVYTMADGKSVASWRPHEKESGDYRSIVWADFLDNDRVLTASKGGTVALWSLPDCKAVWVAERACEGAPALSPGRKYLAAYDNDTVRVLDAATGAGKGTGGAAKPSGARADLSGLAFSADGATLVAFVGGSHLVRWDVKTGKVTAHFHTPMLVQPQANSYSPMVEVCSPGHALLDGRILMDLDRMANVWSYFGSKASAGGPDGRHWYVAGGQFAIPGQAQPAVLVPVVIPDPAVSRAVALVGNSAVKPLLRVGMKVAITLEMNGPTKDAQAYKNQVIEAFASKLRANGMTVGDGGGVWVIAHVEEKPSGQTFKYRNFGDSPFNGPRGEIPLMNYEVELQIADSQGRIPLAPKQSFPMPAPHFIRLPAGEDLASYLKNMAWNNMKSYLTGAGVPYYVARQPDGVVTLPGVTNFDPNRK